MNLIRSFKLSNYRAFDKATELKLAPITLIFGDNNAGKSGIVRLLPFLSDSFDPRLTAPLNLDSPSVRGAGFSDLLCHATESQTIEFELSWDDINLAVQFRELEGSVRASWFRIKLAALQFEASWTGPDDLYENERAHFPVTFQGIAPRPNENLPTWATEIHQRALLLPQQVLWLEATRLPVGREVPAPRIAPISIGNAGERAVAACAFDEEVRRTVSKWYEENFKVEFNIYRLANLVRPELRRIGTSFSVPMVDCGEGFSQVLPVITAAALLSLGRGPRILCLEHPELHLHPDVHGAISKLFCDITRHHLGLCIIETHSENLLLALLLQVAKGDLDPQSLAIYWVRQRGDGTSLAERVDLLPGARLGAQFPPGVFREDSELSRLILMERRRREA